MDKDWTYHKWKKQISEWSYWDMDTGEIIEEKKFKENYKKHGKDKKIRYTRIARITEHRVYGRKQQQLRLFEE